MNIRTIGSMALFGALSVAGMIFGDGIQGVFTFIDLPSMVTVSGLITAGAMWSFPFAVTKQAISDAYATESLEKDRAWLDYEVFMRLSNLSVASGLYGTLIGLVKMLNHIDGTSTIGPAMAFALLPLFYGLILGEFVFKSMATSFLTRTESKILRANRDHTTTDL